MREAARVSKHPCISQCIMRTSILIHSGCSPVDSQGVLLQEHSQLTIAFCRTSDSFREPERRGPGRPPGRYALLSDQLLLHPCTVVCSRIICMPLIVLCSSCSVTCMQPFQASIGRCILLAAAPLQSAACNVPHALYVQHACIKATAYHLLRFI